MNNLVKALRLKRKMTQAELAASCGVSRQTIVSVEHGVFTPSLTLGYKLSKVLRYKLDDLFDFSEVDAELKSLKAAKQSKQN